MRLSLSRQLAGVWQKARPILGGTAVILLSNSLLKAANAGLFVLVAHGLDPDSAGYYSTATSLAAIAFNVSLMGLDEVLVREVAGRASSERVFANLLITRIVLTSLSAGLLMAIVWGLQVYPVHLNSIIGLLAIGQIGEGVMLLCQTLLVTASRLKSVWMLAAIISGLRIMLGAGLIASGGGLMALIFMMALTSGLGAAAAFRVAAHNLLGLDLGGLLAQAETAHVWRRIRQGGSFFGIALFVMVEFQADVVLLSIMRMPAEVAMYSAAQMLIIAAWIAPQAYRAVIYPRLSALVESESRFWIFYRLSSKLALFLGMLLCFSIVLFSPLLISILYPPEYLLSSTVLQILAFSVFFAFLSIPNTRAMLALHKEREVAILSAISMMANIGMNVMLIPTFGVLGASTSRVISSTVLFVMSLFYTARIRRSICSLQK